MDLWEANLFGLPRVRWGDHSVDHFQTRQAALLLAYLVHFPRRHQRDELVDLLWPDADPDSGRPRLSQAIWRIRQIFRELRPDSDAEVVVSDRNTVAIDPALITSDVARFQLLLQRAANLDGAPRMDALGQAAAIYGDSGGFLVGFYDDWVLQERERLLTQYIAALEEMASRFESTGEWKRALEAAERAAAADPLLEDSHRHWIRLLAASGQPAAALRQYQNLARILARELNTEPSEATRALIAEIRQAETERPSAHASLVSPVPAAPSSPLQVAPLIAPLTNFYGRETILREIGALLDAPAIRLITLLGTGGVGKTRLALELARGVAARSSEPAVAMVSLADIAQPLEVAEAIANALTPLRKGSPMQRIANALTAAPDAPPFLLVLDNAEHLAAPMGAIVAEMLALVPRLKILVTSQRNLGVSGEHEVTLAPLELPGARRAPSSVAAPPEDDPQNAPSVQLFLDRAKSVRPGFPTDAVRLAEVARICERLEGLPLAIELCAGWAQTLGTRQMLDMLERRFELLVSRRTDIPARHRTLRAAIEYSYIQLSAPMQEHLATLAVFRGGWTLAAAADVCMGGSTPAALAMLAQMREHSLIVADEARVGDGMRYKMLESLRDFASDQRTMGQIKQHGAAHAAYFARFAHETVARMLGPESALWAARLDDELENIRAALEYLISSREIEAAWTVTAEVSRAWNAHGHAREAHQWIARALAMPEPSEGDGAEDPQRGARLQRLRARLLTTQAGALHILSDYTESIAAAEQALAIWRALGDTGGMTECVGMMGITAMLNDDFDRAQTLLAQALPLARTLGDPKIIAQTLNDLGGVAMALQDWPAASDLLKEALEVRRQIGEPRGVCSSLSNLGLLSIHQANYDAARVFLREASALQTLHRFVWFSVIDGNLAIVERLGGNYGESLRLMNAAIRSTLSHGERRLLAWSAKEMGHLAVALKQYALGLRLLSCAEAMRIAIGMSFKPMGPQDIERDRAAAERVLGATDAAANWTVGAAAAAETLLAEAQIELAACIHSGEQIK
ncbi:hypothetical protein CCAX7_001710 [Capsulimonas corticalis]|uniref:Uncharacterized protein n=1 Tax=Capsulimonas corticalis TaxID=2219043 RepID=A0A402CRQ1_9BACT|nr:BTAD domain-containing putative transcriptional regulator [Capsulimonas corticalis]BDI28120.1 hypothetical protein CCAX7_001710 [Capsulimonas corticalis]